MVDFIKHLFRSKKNTIYINRDTSNLKKLEILTERLEIITKKNESLYNRRIGDK